MSGYFKRVAQLAKPAALRPSRPSPFGSSQPPATQPVEVPLDAMSDMAVTPPPSNVTASYAGTSLNEELVVQPVRRNPTVQQPQPGADVTPSLRPQVPIESEQRLSIGETIASDLSRIGLSHEHDRYDNLPTVAPPLRQKETVMSAPIQEAHTRASLDRDTVPVETSARSHVPVPASPAQTLPLGVQADKHLVSQVSPAAPIPPRAEPPDGTDRQAASQRMVVSHKPEPEPEPEPVVPRIEPVFNERLSAKQVALADSAPVLSGPRGKPDVTVSIGTVNLSTEAPVEAPQPALRVRQARNTTSASGIWSGGRTFARSYLRRG